MQADWGTAILMEVSTGEIRAITNLTRKGEGNIVEDYNYAIGMNMEPGSTQKLASLITLLDDAGASLDEKYDTGNGTAIIGRTKVTDTHGYGLLTLKGVFEKSSNVGFAKAVNKYYKDDPKRFVEHLYKMGLNEPLHLQIAGGQNPVIRKPGDRWWDGTTLTNMAYGYALLLTPMKTLTFYNAVANDGRMVSPLFVKELRQYGQTLRTYRARTMVSSIASDETLKEVRAAMRGVVEEGTGRILKSRYYKVGGKTGTAQIPVNGRYTDRNGGRHYLATMVGYFPEDDPKYSCLVALKTYNAPGHRRFYYGASLAGPVFRAIADRVYAKNTAWQDPLSQRKEKTDEKPRLKAGCADEMREVAYRFDVRYEGRRGRTDWRGVEAVDSGRDCVYKLRGMVGRSAFGGRDGPEGGRLSAGTPWNGRRVFGGRRRRVPVRPGRNESAPRNADSAGTRLYAVGTGDLPEGEKGGQLGRFRGFFGPRRLKIEQEEIADSYNSGKKDIFVTQRKFYGKTVSILFTGNGPFGDRSAHFRRRCGRGMRAGARNGLRPDHRSRSAGRVAPVRLRIVAERFGAGVFRFLFFRN